MSYKTRIETEKKEQRLLEIPEEQLNEMRKILNDYIAKNRKKHINVLNRCLLRRLGLMLTSEIVEDILQQLYEYSWLNIERVMEFHKTGHLDRYFLSLFYHPATTKNARLRLGYDVRESELGMDELNEYLEDDPQYTNYALDPWLPLEERLKYHRIALDETKNWLWDNPQSNLKKALDLQKSRYGIKGYNVALNYVATPSYKFLYDNFEILKLTNVYTYVRKFRKVCSEVYGKKIQQGNIFPYTKYV